MKHSQLQAYPWHAAHWQQLQLLLEQKRLPHALLLSGPEQIGKLRLTQAFAAQLLCASPTAAGACGDCESCRLLDAGSHPDFRLLQPPEGKRQIGVDQVRALIEFSQQTAYRTGGRKVVIIEPAEAMNINTANALLKTLEEPAGDTVLMLVSHAPSRLLPTIRSRCLSVGFALPATEMALPWLSTLLQGQGDAEQLLRESGGKPVAALKLFEDDGLASLNRCDEVFAQLNGGKTSVIDAVDKLLEADIGFIIDWWVNRLSVVLRQKVAGINAELPAPWPSFLGKPAQQLLDFQQQLFQLRDRFQRGVALNQRLVLEGLLIEWFVEAPKVTRYA